MRIGDTRPTASGSSQRPLDGVRILSLEQMQALPYATQLMAHLGADVVKVEHPIRGDSGRAARPQITDADGRPVGATYLRNNLGKRSIGIDLKNPAGRELVLALASHFDVITENSTAGAMDRLGLGWKDIEAVSPGTIYASISGFGNLRPSPYRNWPAFAPVAEAMGGIYEPNRKGDGPPPVVVAGALGDNASALFSVIGILCALRQREQTGRGQHVDVAMYDSMIAMGDMVPNLHSLGWPAKHATAGATAIVAAFRARDGYFVVAVFREHMFERLARTVGHPEWIGHPAFATREDWAGNLESTVRPAIEAWAANKTKLDAARALCEEGIAAGPSNTGADMAGDPHVRDHDMLIDVPVPEREKPMQVHGNPIKFSDAAEGPIRTFPGLGEHTDEVLREALGLDGDQLSRLRENGAIGP